MSNRIFSKSLTGKTTILPLPENATPLSIFDANKHGKRDFEIAVTFAGSDKEHAVQRTFLVLREGDELPEVECEFIGSIECTDYTAGAVALMRHVFEQKGES